MARFARASGREMPEPGHLSERSRRRVVDRNPVERRTAAGAAEVRKIQRLRLPAVCVPAVEQVCAVGGIAGGLPDQKVVLAIAVHVPGIGKRERPLHRDNRIRVADDVQLAAPSAGLAEDQVDALFVVRPTTGVGDGHRDIVQAVAVVVARPRKERPPRAERSRHRQRMRAPAPEFAGSVRWTSRSRRFARRCRRSRAQSRQAPRRLP